MFESRRREASPPAKLKTIRFTPDEVDALEAAAKAGGITFSEFVRAACGAALAAQPAAPDGTSTTRPAVSTPNV